MTAAFERLVAEQLTPERLVAECPVPVRLVASDLDGTLVRSDGTVSQRSRDALARARAAGAALVLVTGRPPRWMRTIAEQTGHTGVALVGNGAGVYDLRAERLLHTDPLTPEVTREVITRVLAAVPDAAFAGETGDAFLREQRYASPYGDAPDRRIASRAEIVALPLLKLLVRTPSHDADAFLAAAREVVGDELATLTHSSSDGLLEVSAAGVSKASALARYAASLGVGPAETVAFGDMPNDVPMLAWAGRSWAVADAHPAARAAAGAVTAGNDDDGVALVLERLFP